MLRITPCLQYRIKTMKSTERENNVTRENVKDKCWGESHLVKQKPKTIVQGHFTQISNKNIFSHFAWSHADSFVIFVPRFRDIHHWDFWHYLSAMATNINYIFKSTSLKISTSISQTSLWTLVVTPAIFPAFPFYQTWISSAIISKSWQLISKLSIWQDASRAIWQSMFS